jgi:competence protein ComEA
MTIREQLLLLGVAVAILIGAAVLIWRGSGHGAPPPDTFTARDPQPAAMSAATPPKSAPTTPPALPPSAPTVLAASKPASPAPPTRIGVGILGAVEKEGLFYFEAGARVRDLLQAAGGALEDADLSDVNRTAPLIDQTTLLVPRLASQGNQLYSDPPVTYNPRPYTRSTWYQFNKQTQEPEPVGAAGSSASATPEKSSPGGLVNINTATQAELESLPGIGPATAQKIIAHRQSEPFQTIDDLDKVSGIGPSKMNDVRAMITVK